MDLASNAGKFARSRPTIECAQCGEHLYVPEWTEYLDGGRILASVAMRGLRHLVRDRDPLIAAAC